MTDIKAKTLKLSDIRFCIAPMMDTTNRSKNNRTINKIRAVQNFVL